MTKAYTPTEISEIRNLARNLAKAQTLEVLIQTFELTNTLDGPEIPEVRGVLMDELEARDYDAFYEWLESGDDSPRAFFLAKPETVKRGILHTDHLTGETTELKDAE